MAVELTPSGTRGRQFPRLPGFVAAAATGVQLVFFRLLGRRVRVANAELLLLTTIGAKTGKTRRAVLGCFPDRDTWLVVASFGGSMKHPAWYVNMARNPGKVWIEVGGRKLPARAEALKGAERDEAWRRIVMQSPNYAAYQQNTDRQIPVVRLTAR